MSQPRDRRKAEIRGRRAEFLCRCWLRLKFYRILERGFRVPTGEIDIVARRGRIVAFIEVKARGDMTQAAFAVTPNQRRRIARAASHFLATRADLQDCQPRFDVMLALPRKLPRHIKNAWGME